MQKVVKSESTFNLLSNKSIHLPGSLKRKTVHAQIENSDILNVILILELNHF